LHGVVIRLDSFGRLEHVSERHRNDMRRLQGYHVIPFFIGDSAHRGAPESHRQKPIVTRWLTTPLEMSEHE
jgi:hypothetical protein